MDYGTYTPGPRRDPRRRRRQQARRRLLVLVAWSSSWRRSSPRCVISRGGGDDGRPAARRRIPLRRRRGVAATPKPTVPPPKVWEASTSDPVRVWVGGDSMGGELGWCLGPMLEKTEVFKPILYYKESTGICRWDFFDWGDKIESVMRTDKPDAVVMMMGTNDTQSVWHDGTWISHGTRLEDRLPEARLRHDGRHAQGRRPARVLGRHADHAGVLAQLAHEAHQQDHPERRGGEPGGAVHRRLGALRGLGRGLRRDWRLADGVHFTVEGQQRLAKAVLKDIKKDWLPDGVPSPSPSPAASSSASASPSI